MVWSVEDNLKRKGELEMQFRQLRTGLPGTRAKLLKSKGAGNRKSEEVLRGSRVEEAGREQDKTGKSFKELENTLTAAVHM